MTAQLPATVLPDGSLVVQAIPELNMYRMLLDGVTQFDFEGVQFLRMDYTPKNCGVIFDNLGIYIQGPAHNWSGYSGRFTPRPEQRVTVDLMTQNNRFYCFNGLGTGKTASAIWAAEYIRATEKHNLRVLIVTTLSCTKMVWDAELANICPHRSRVIVRGTRDERESRVAAGYDYTIINHDGVKSTFDPLMKAGYDLIILDEASVYRNDGTDRSKMTRDLCKGKRCWALTATPRPRSSMDAWGLGKLVNPKRLPKSKLQFQNTTMMQASDFVWVDRPGSLAVVFDVLRPAIRIRTEDCVSLPDTTYIDREVPMSKMQEAARVQLIKDQVYALQSTPGQSLSIVNAADLRNKVLQIAQGAVRLDETTADEIDYKPSLDETKSLIDQVDGKTIVFATFRAPIFRLARDLAKEYGPNSVAVCVGGQGSKRDEELGRFINDPNCRVLVAHPNTASHGLNLTMANLTVWFGLTSSAEIYEQANARMKRPGQTRKMIVAHILRCPEDRNTLAVCQRRANEQQVLLDMVADYTKGRF